MSFAMIEKSRDKAKSLSLFHVKPTLTQDSKYYYRRGLLILVLKSGRESLSL